MKGKHWTIEEDILLKSSSDKLTYEQLSLLLKRTKLAIKTRANRLKIQVLRPTSEKKILFTEKEFLDAIKSSNSHKEAYKKLGYKVNPHRNSNENLYFQLFNKLNPDIYHFSQLSKGCSKNHIIDRRYEAQLLYKYHVTNAKYNNKYFDLDFETFILLITSNCYYCGIDGEFKKKGSGNKNYINKFCGIDRVDSSKGYTLDNVVPCCGKCNIMKNKFNQSDFFDKIRKIYQNHNLGENNNG